MTKQPGLVPRYPLRQARWLNRDNPSRPKQYSREFVAESAQHTNPATWYWRRRPGVYRVLERKRIGYNVADRRRLNSAAVHLLQDLRQETNLTSGRFIVTGTLSGLRLRADGYKVAQVTTIDESAEYHREQVETLRDAGADRICPGNDDHDRRRSHRNRENCSVSRDACCNLLYRRNGRLTPFGNEIERSHRLCRSWSR